MNKLDRDYTNLLKDILDNGHEKGDRTGTGTLSVFGRQIRHKMSDGFPLITTKKMYMKGIVTELIWFLRGDTNIKYLLDNDCNIWNGDAYKNFIKNPVYESKNAADLLGSQAGQLLICPTQEDFINKIKTDDEFAKKWGDLGPLYGKQWRTWETIGFYIQNMSEDKKHWSGECWNTEPIDQISNLINDLKTNPDSRRLMVNAWNVGELDQMTLPPCHYGFQVYTRELSLEERQGKYVVWTKDSYDENGELKSPLTIDWERTPKRAISLKWQQRSVDTFLGLPFNIASYGLLLEILAKEVNMVPDELIGDLGDTHLYLNHIEQAKEQIGRELSFEERADIYKDKHNIPKEIVIPFVKRGGRTLADIPTQTREPYPLPRLVINDEFWNPDSTSFDNTIKGMSPDDFYVLNYQSHPSIKAPLSN